MNETNVVTDNIPLPEEVKKKLDEARDNITIMEGEGKRLARINRELSKDIDSAISRKVQADKDSAEALSKLNKLKSDITTAENDKTLVQSSLDTVKASLLEAETKLATIKLEQASIDSANKVASDALVSRSAELDKREKAITLKETELSDIKSDIAVLLAKF